MSNSVAEAYLLIVRESNVPIFGEAVPVPFTGQIELDSWSWNIKNDVAVDRKKAEDKRKLDEKSEGKGASPTSNSTATPKDKSPPFKPDALIRQVAELQVKAGMAQPLRDKKVQELIKKAVLGFAEDAASGDDGKDDDADMKMKLTFEKGTDLATTPLLYALARGDLIPKAILTLFHRSKNAPVTLAITLSNLRFTKCDISCEAEDYMSDVKETWEATYESIDWVYRNRPAASGPNFVTQGTARVFAMKQKLLPF
jgi:type VI protein secretion system component Hcp